MRLGLTLAAAVAASVLATATPAAATTVPTPTLRIIGYGAAQVPSNETESHQYNGGGRCATLISDGNLPPRPLLVEPGRLAAEIALHTGQKPSGLHLGISRHKFGGGETVRAAKLVQRHSKWFIDFSLSIRAGQDLYPTLSVSYGGDRPCNAASATYGFHLRGARG